MINRQSSSSSIWEKSSYRNVNVQYLIDVPIREYDISKANISVLRDADIITEDRYQYLLKAPKLEREISIGKLQGSNPKITERLKAGIADARRLFISQNHLDDKEILFIKNDSVTVIGSRPITFTSVSDRVRFRLAGEYTSYYRVNYLDLMYYYNPLTKVENMRSVGLGSSEYLHSLYMTNLLKQVFQIAQNEGVQNAISFLSAVYPAYINLKFDSTEYYREYNSQSKFKMKPISRFVNFYMDYISPNDLQYVDISYNEAIFRLLNKIYSRIYFGKR